MLVLSDNDRYLVVGHAFVEQIFERLLYLDDHLMVVVVGRQHLYLDPSFLRLALRHFLCHLCLFVGLLDDGRVLSEHGRGRVEESVVEVDDVALGTIVGVEVLLTYDVRVVMFVETLQELPVAIAPTVDALLDVTDDEAPVLVGDAVVEQNLEVGPLHGRGVLELIDHDIAQLSAYLLVDERRVLLVDEVVEQLLRVGERVVVVVGVDVVDLLLDTSEESQLVDVLQREVDGVDGYEGLLSCLLGLRDEWCHKLADGLCLRRVDVTLFDISVRVGQPILHVAVGHLHLSVREVAVAEVFEIAGHVAVTVGIAGIGEAVLCGNGIVAVGISLHCAECLGFQGSEL